VKLKLETQNGVRLLQVTESVAAADIGVLRAGVAKLFGESQSAIVLELTGSSLEAAARARLGEVLMAAPGEDSLLLIASADPELGAAPTAQACLELLASPAAKLLAHEARLRSRLSLARTQKTEIDRQLEQTAALADEMKKLRRATASLRLVETALEERIRQAISSRKTPLGPHPARDSLLDARDVLRRVFKEAV
jgi:hypothetical protein